MPDGPSASPELAMPAELVQQYTEVRQVTRVEDIPLLQQAAAGKKLAVNVLRNAGEDYYMMEFDPSRGKNVNGRGPFKVPEGNSFVLISGMSDRQRGLQGFWEEYDKLKEERDQQNQPPK